MNARTPTSLLSPALLAVLFSASIASADSMKNREQLDNDTLSDAAIQGISIPRLSAGARCRQEGNKLDCVQKKAADDKNDNSRVETPVEKGIQTQGSVSVVIENATPQLTQPLSDIPADADPAMFQGYPFSPSNPGAVASQSANSLNVLLNQGVSQTATTQESLVQIISSSSSSLLRVNLPASR